MARLFEQALPSFIEIISNYILIERDDIVHGIFSKVFACLELFKEDKINI